MGEYITKEQVLESMKRPDLLTPRTVFESYAFLSALYAEIHVKLSLLKAQMAGMEVDALGMDMTSAKAKQLVRGGIVGQEAIKLEAELAGIEAMIQALKKAQAYFSEESRNQY